MQFVCVMNDYLGPKILSECTAPGDDGSVRCRRTPSVAFLGVPSLAPESPADSALLSRCSSPVRSVSLALFLSSYRPVRLLPPSSRFTGNTSQPPGSLSPCRVVTANWRHYNARRGRSEASTPRKDGRRSRSTTSGLRGWSILVGVHFVWKLASSCLGARALLKQTFDLSE